MYGDESCLKFNFLQNEVQLGYTSINIDGFIKANKGDMSELLNECSVSHERSKCRSVLTFDLTQSTPPGDMSELLNECSVAWAEFRPRKRSVR